MNRDSRFAIFWIWPSTTSNLMWTRRRRPFVGLQTRRGAAHAHLPSLYRSSIRRIHNSWLLRWHFVLSLHDTYQLLSNAIFFLGGSMMRIANMFACQGTKETKMLFLAALYLKNESMIWSLPLDYSCPRSCEIRAALSSWDMLDFVHCEAITVNTCGRVY